MGGNHDKNYCIQKKQCADSRDFMTNLLFCKWMIAIILSLGVETKRYSALHRFLPGVTQKMSTTEHFNRLECAGIVRRFFIRRFRRLP